MIFYSFVLFFFFILGFMFCLDFGFMVFSIFVYFRVLIYFRCFVGGFGFYGRNLRVIGDGGLMVEGNELGCVVVLFVFIFIF